MMDMEIEGGLDLAQTIMVFHSNCSEEKQLRTEWTPGHFHQH